MSKSIKELEVELNVLKKDKKQLQSKIHKLYKTINKLKAEEVFGEDLELTPESIMAAPYFEVESIIFKKLNVWLKEEYPHVKSSGYILETNQMALQLWMGQKDIVKEVAKQWEKWIPFIQEIDGQKIISIMEHTCSEYGSYDLIIESSKYIIRKMYYTRPEIEASFDDLESALIYIKKHHPWSLDND